MVRYITLIFTVIFFYKTKIDTEKTSTYVQIDTVNLKVPKEINTPKSLVALFKNIEKTLEIDFTGDGINDYLCYTKKYNANGEYTLVENWITSSLKTLRTKDFVLEYDYKWFIDLDNDKIPEIVKAQGESEGINYGLYKLDFSKPNDALLFYFNPVIEYKNEFFWGYPWEIKDIVLKHKLIKFTLDHTIVRDGEIIRPKWQKVFPVLIFKGKNELEADNLKGVRVFKIEHLKNLQFIKVEDLTHLIK